MFKINPYRPGAGLMPMYIAGRDADITEMEQIFDALTLNIPVQSVIYSGLRGVGKTVLINQLFRIAKNKKIFCRHIEVEARNDFLAQIATCSQMYLREVSVKERAKELIGNALNAVKSLKFSFVPEDGSFSLSVQEQELYRSSNLTQSLTEVFTSIGEIAYEFQCPICFFIDEIQYMESKELGALIAAIHRTNQLGFPIMIIGAGLPKIYKMLSDEKSYSERLFMYKEIGSLSEEQAKKAIEEPAKQLSVQYSNDAVHRIIDITKGYPYFIQQLCKLVFAHSTDYIIGVNEVNEVVNDFFDILDKGFFKVRYERCSETEKRFLFSMVKCEILPCTISNVAKNLKKEVQSISPTRAQLINKGVIYAVKYKELDFTVPEFSGFIQRLGEFQQWLEFNS